MKNMNLYFLIGQLAMAAGVLLNIFFKDNNMISFISGFLVGLSLVFNFFYYFYINSRKEK